MNTYMTEGVGKRIVDALKKQSEVEFVSQVETPPAEEQVPIQEVPPVVAVEPQVQSEQVYASPFENKFVNPQPTPAFTQPSVMPQMPQDNAYSSLNTRFTDFGGLEVPANVMILKQLISQLPTGVSRQAGALVIKQTMEALGISMKSVLSEAQQLQENINASARDCQNNILECKKQINTLEAQVQAYQKQSAALNDIVSLFLQIN